MRGKPRSDAAITPDLPAPRSGTTLDQVGFDGYTSGPTLWIYYTSEPTVPTILGRLSLALVVVSALLLAACDRADPPDIGSARTPPKDDHVWRSMTDQMDKAKGVEGQLLETNQNRMKGADGN